MQKQTTNCLNYFSKWSNWFFLHALGILPLPDVKGQNQKLLKYNFSFTHQRLYQIQKEFVSFESISRLRVKYIFNYNYLFKLFVVVFLQFEIFVFRNCEQKVE